MQRKPEDPSRSALREPMLWLVIALPSIGVVAGIATLIIALRAGGADAIPAEVRRTAQIQVEDIAADQRADALGLRAALELDRDTGAVSVTLVAAEPVADARMTLLLQHPAEASADNISVLVRSGDRWFGRIDPAPAAHAWNLRLSARDGRWRLSGRLEAGAHVAALRPRLER